MFVHKLVDIYNCSMCLICEIELYKGELDYDNYDELELQIVSCYTVDAKRGTLEYIHIYGGYWQRDYLLDKFDKQAMSSLKCIIYCVG